MVRALVFLAFFAGGAAALAPKAAPPAPKHVAMLKTAVKTACTTAIAGSAPAQRIAPVQAVPVPVAVPTYGGYGYGGGFGISPGAMIGLSVIDMIADEQRRQAYLRNQLETQRQLGKSSAEIDNLTRQLAAQDAKLAQLQAQQAQQGAK